MNAITNYLAWFTVNKEDIPCIPRKKLIAIMKDIGFERLPQKPQVGRQAIRRISTGNHRITNKYVAITSRTILKIRLASAPKRRLLYP